MPKKTVAKFSIEYMQVLSEDGKVDEKLDPKLPDDQLLLLYRTMMLSRRTDERLLKLQRQGRLGTLPVGVGQEAASAGPVLALNRETDWFVGAYRELAGRVLWGEELHRPMLVYNGYEEGNVTPGVERILPTYVILGSQLPNAVGIGYAAKMRGEKSVVISFHGDGAASEGDVHEAMNFASVWNTPNIFINQNNHWAISTPLTKQMHSETLAQRGLAYGIPSIQVDGNDVLATYVATKQAAERARKGEGPTLIEALTYRMLMHTTADDPKKYRKEEEVESWTSKDPIVRFRLYLEGKKLWDDKKEQTLEEEIKGEIAKAVETFEAMRDIKMDEPFDHIYGSDIPEIEQQRADFLENLRKDQDDA